jgi:hypothetical protein
MHWVIEAAHLFLAASFAVDYIGYDTSRERGDEAVKGESNQDDFFTVRGIIIGAKEQPYRKPGDQAAKQQSNHSPGYYDQYLGIAFFHDRFPFLNV